MEENKMLSVTFSGELSDECKSYLKEQQKKFEMFKFVFYLIGVLVLSILIGAFLHWLLFVLVFVVGALPLAFIFIKSFSIGDYPVKIVIDEEALRSYTPKNEYEVSIIYVEKVVDAGDYWYFVFEGGKMPVGYICQKNLLTEGTLEDFEKIFEGKIVIN